MCSYIAKITSLRKRGDLLYVFISWRKYKGHKRPPRNKQPKSLEEVKAEEKTKSQIKMSFFSSGD
ncbi:hypothetical protein GCM10008986_00150 [Salinibacillus aidingensis]|uniref:Uncharacterized protein n=1 Tax=Salinibacillus aidingensis TaxID=237684 RepID=A0ABN1ALT0_9BACI